tara:strand:- start:397 stop:699 length:303 start_codon:yes stop_codon:yes gene_type:complete
MNRFYGGSNNLYGGELNNEDSIKDATKDIFKKEKLTKQKKEQEQGQGQGQGDGQKTTNSFILSNDLTRVLKKNRELYNYIEILENEKKELQDRIKQLEKK